MEAEEYVKEEKLDFPDELIKSPYSYICDWMEEILPHTGRRAFEVISLIPPSLILPDLPYQAKKIRSNINVLLLTASGGGKSTIAKEFSFLTYSPLEVESITPAKLETAIMNHPLFSLIVGDFARMSRDPVVVKIVEGILGEEKRISRMTMKKEIDIDTDGVALLCGIPNDLSDYLTSGLIFRIIPICIFHDQDEHSDIGKKIASSIGENGEYDEKEMYIKKYYNELFNIQTGQNKSIPPIEGYHIDEEFKKKAYETWNKLTEEIHMRLKAPLNWFRSLQECFRILVAHAFLNVFNRKVENGILYPNEEDFKIAIKLMKRDLSTKYKLVGTQAFVRSITSIKELSRIMESDKLSEEQKKMIQSLVKIKRGKVVG